MNIDLYQAEVNRRFHTDFKIPILFFTQLVGLAFGMDAKALGIGSEVVSSPARPRQDRHRGAGSRGRRREAVGAGAAKPRLPKAKKGPELPMPRCHATRRPGDERRADRTSREKVGVYVCHCGSNIAGTVDVEAVRDWAAETLAGHGVVIARDNKFMCSSTGQELIEKDIAELGLTRVVVAACSPHMHEKTFRGACARAGLNPYLCELVSIREQVSWVHTDKAAATAKAKAVVAGGVFRVEEHAPLEPIRSPSTRPRSSWAAGSPGSRRPSSLPTAGFPVHMVEREPSIGGHMAQFDKTFPTLDCAACILTPKMNDVGMHPNVTLHTWSEVTDLSGYVGSFAATIRHKARYVNADLCTGCGICQEKCVSRIVDQVYEAGIGYRKGIYMPFPQAAPRCPCWTRAPASLREGDLQGLREVLPTGAIDFTQQDDEVTVEVGNVVVATGFELFDARRVEPYGYGRLPNVFTSLEFERMSNAAGPTNGRIVLRDGVTEPKAVGIIHCVGSRDRNYNSYCSAICCMQSLKFAHLVGEHTGATVYNFYIDIRAPGKAFDEFYQRVLEEGTIFVRGRVAEVTDASASPTRPPRTAASSSRSRTRWPAGSGASPSTW